MAGERIAVALLAVIALALRLFNIGHLGLVADEGHQALAVAGILDQGIPVVPSGTVYLRGGPFVYAEAAVAKVLGVDEASLRLPAALFGAAAVVLVYSYGRMLFGSSTALTAAFLLTFSLWGLELARYARMYTLFQLGFLGSAIAFYRGTIEGRRAYQWATPVLFALTVTTHELGIMVLGLLALPIFLPPERLPAHLHGRGKWRLVIPALVFGALWIGYHGIEARLLVRHLTAVTPAPLGTEEGAEAIAAPGGGPLLGYVRDHLLVPAVSLPWDLRSRNLPTVLGALALAAIAGIAAASGLASPGRGKHTLWALGILCAAFLNLFELAIIGSAAYLILLPGGLRELKRRPLAPAVAGAAALAAYWGIYLLRHPQARLVSWGMPFSVADAFFGYPPFEDRVVSWFASGWPAMSVIVAVTMGVLLIRFARDRRRASELYAAGVILIPLFGVTMTREIHNESRYHFHLYPFVLVVFALALAAAARFLCGAADTLAALAGRRFPGRRGVEAALVVLMAVLLSPDLSPPEIARFLSRDYATPKDPVRAVLNWRPYASFHQDHVGAAKRVQAELEPDDRIVVVGPTYWASIYWYYLGRVDYVVSERGARLMRDGFLVHHVTGARCIVSVDDLDQMLAAESDRRLWILADLNLLGGESRHYTPPMRRRLRELVRHPIAIGRDLDTIVARREATSPYLSSPPSAQPVVPARGTVAAGGRP